VPSATAAANERSAFARVRGTKEAIWSMEAPARASGAGKITSDPWASPKARAIRPAKVVAARTETICPAMARTAVSKRSNAPGMRSPGRARESGPTRPSGPGAPR